MAHTMETKLGGTGGVAPKFLRALGEIRILAVKCLEVIVIWQERAEQRHALRELDQRMLKDVGISASEAARESRKPFWLP